MTTPPLPPFMTPQEAAAWEALKRAMQRVREAQEAAAEQYARDQANAPKPQRRKGGRRGS
jgi:hypothetical protein